MPSPSLSFSRLSDLDLTGNYITDAGLISISRALTTNTSLITLSLASNGISRQGPFDSFMNSLPYTTANMKNDLDTNHPIPQKKIQLDLELSRIETDFPGLCALCISLGKENMGLQNLDLRGNYIGSAGGSKVKECLLWRKANKKASPCVVAVTERMEGEIFEDILDLNDYMGDLLKKMKGGKGKKGKK